MSTSFLSKVDPLNSVLAYVGVVGLALVLSVFMGMSMVWPGDELGAYLHHEAPSAGSGPDTASGREEVARTAPSSHKPQNHHAAHAVDSIASSGTVAEAKAVITVSSQAERR